MKKIILCILDGVGLSDNKKGNAFYIANTKNLDRLIEKFGMDEIEASKEFVGLSKNQMGNSEVGHLNIGAGRVFDQPLERINKSIKDKSFFENEELLRAIKNSKVNNSKLHIIGMLSDGGVHSSIKHIEALLKMCKDNDVKDLYFHIFTDGRDTKNNSALIYLDELQKHIDNLKLGSIASVCGRFYGMDRDKRWDRVEKAYNLLVNNIGEKYSNYKDLIKHNYERNIYDEFINPGLIDEKGKIESGDSIIWANFRPDRSWELPYALSNHSFDEFKTLYLTNVNLTTLMGVSDLVKNNVAFKDIKLKNTFGNYISKFNLKQLRIAETEKYAHVTYFFDGLEDKEIKGCKRILIPSPKVKTYDLKPKMSAKKITDTLLKEMNNNYDFILINFANGDMVGHTGMLKKAVTAVEEIDKNINRIYKKCLKKGYTLIITADHGNCEEMLDNNKCPLTTHTTNKVPFIVCEKHDKTGVKKLSDIAPYMLKLMNLKIPDEMK